jgi:hypothetical protein
MSSDAKVWQDASGWRGKCDACEDELEGTDYSLTDILIEIEDKMEQKLHWEIFEFGNGLGLSGYRAKP